LSSLIELKNIRKKYVIGGNELVVLKGIGVTVNEGELTAIIGPSGSGKSSIMNIIGLLDRPSSGEYLLKGKLVADYNDDELAKLRNETIGFVFQSFFLLSRLSALQNVGLPLFYRGTPTAEIKERSINMLDKVGMKEYAKHKPFELSGGQQQRVAIARALVSNPSVILADEPTGALDTKIGQEVMNLFVDLNKTDRTTVLMITHNPEIAQQCRRVITIQDGNIKPEEE